MQAANGSATDKQVHRATYACIFLGVPNQGLNVGQLMGMVKGQRNERLVSDLAIGSPVLQQLHAEFCKFFDFPDFRMISVYETKLSRAVEVGVPRRCQADTRFLIC